MSVTKLKAFNSPDVMKTEEGNDSLDTIIRQAIGKEPLLSFSRHGDNPVQWIQLLNAFDQQELPGRPLLSPLKLQMQKCEKCSREFFSTINYRRHIRAYHRLKRLEKDSTKNRELLAAFWDKLSLEEAIEVVSSKNALFEEVPGSAIIKNLTALIRKPGFSVFPLTYLKTGSVLLDIVQGRPSRFPQFSRELFGILDDASEKTFLCGTAASMQKYIFDGEAAKISLETKNLVSCLSFLVEQKLVKAWLADKDAESLRYQKLLVEEEEAAQKRQADLLERKRQKKLRQKEQRAKEHGLEEMECMEDGAQMLNVVPSGNFSIPSVDCNIETHDPDILPDHISPSSVAFQRSNTLEVKDLNVEERKAWKSVHKQLNSRRHLIPKSQQRLRNGFHAEHNPQAGRILATQNHGSSKQLKSAPVVNVHKVWSRKPKRENNGDRWKVIVQKEEAITSGVQLKSHEVLIGSISVTLGNCSHEEEKCDSTTSGMNSMTVKIWRPVSGNGDQGPDRVQNFDGESEMDGNDQILLDESNKGIRGNSFLAEGSILPANGMPYSRDTAKAFLLQRWKEAMMAEHVKLVLSPVEELQDRESPSQLSNFNKSNHLADEEKQLVASKILGSRIAGATEAKLRAKPEKSVKLKYISKQRRNG